MRVFVQACRGFDSRALVINGLSCYFWYGFVVDDEELLASAHYLHVSLLVHVQSCDV